MLFKQIIYYILFHHRYHRVLIQYYMYIVDELSQDEVKNFENTLNQTKTYFPTDWVIDFYKGIFYKLTDRKKEGNKILRSIALVDGADNSEFTNEITQIGQVLYNTGKKNVANLFYQEGSKLHLFLSPFQRPLLFLPEVETKPIWPADLDGDLDDGLTPYKKQLTELLNNWTSIKGEALEVGKNITAHSSWVRLPYLENNLGSIVKTAWIIVDTA